MKELSFAAFAGLAAGTGVLLIISAWRRAVPNLSRRVQEASPTFAVQSVAAMKWVPKWFQHVFELLGSTTASVSRRLVLLGQPDALISFRLQQVVFAVAASATATSLVTPLVLQRDFLSAAFLIGLSLVLGALVGISAMDWLLTVRARARQGQIEAQVPDASELLALAVSAGESIPDALERVARSCTGAISEEIETCTRQVRLGKATTEALTELGQRNDSAALDRLCRTLVSAVERGAPLAQVLHDQARDIREHSRAQLMEEGGKREIAMLFPVVFLILPITILFALYPGLMFLSLSP